MRALALLTPRQVADQLGVPGKNAERVIRERSSADGKAMFAAVRVAGHTLIDPLTVDLYASAMEAAARLGLLAIAKEHGLDWQRSLLRMGRGPTPAVTIVRLGRTFVVTRESLDRFICGGVRTCS